MQEIGIIIFLLLAIGLCFAICPVGGMLILLLCVIGLFKQPKTNHSKDKYYENYIKFIRDEKK